MGQNYRRKGVARLLFRKTFEAARLKGYEKILTFIRADNPAALKTYQVEGFQIIGTAQRQARIDGEYVDEIFVERMLYRRHLACKLASGILPATRSGSQAGCLCYVAAQSLSSKEQEKMKLHRPCVWAAAALWGPLALTWTLAQSPFLAHTEPERITSKQPIQSPFTSLWMGAEPGPPPRERPEATIIIVSGSIRNIPTSCSRLPIREQS